MSSGGFEASPRSTSAILNDSRRTSGPISLAYDRPLTAIASRRRSPSPVMSRRYVPYNSYVPPRAGPSYRDDYPNVYRPVMYRPERITTYYSRSPSPDRYEHSRGPDTDAWDRPIPWSTSNKTPTWQDRRPAPASPPSSGSRDRGRRDTMMATRMFEPSDAWKQTHIDRPARTEGSRLSPVDRYPDHRVRDLRDLSPERPARVDRSPPYHPSGDRYRPGHYREGYSNGRPDYNTYRPQYDDTWTPSHPREPPGSTDSFRRDPISIPYARSSSHCDYNGRRLSSPDRSVTDSISPRSHARSPSRLGVPYRDASRDRRSVSNNDQSPHNSRSGVRRLDSVESDDFRQTQVKSRSSSRSSIASTHVSDNPPSPLHNGSSSQPQTHPSAIPGGVVSVKADWAALNESEPKHLQSSLCAPNSEPVPETFDQNPVDISNSTQPGVTVCLTSQDFRTDRQQEPNGLISTDVLPLETQPLEPSNKVLPDEAEANPALQPPNSPHIHVLSSLASQPLPQPHSSPTEPHLPAIKPLPVVAARPPGTFSSLSANLHGQDDGNLSRVPASSTSSQELPTNLQEDKVSSPTVSGSSQASPIPIPGEASGGETQFLVNSHITEKPKDPAVDTHPEDIPKLSDAKSWAEALRMVVRTRLLCDRQTREERVNPVLMANLSIIRPPSERPSTSADELIAEVTEGKRLQARMDSLALSKPSLLKRFEERQAALTEKAQRLREEYMSLHERWLAHCASLNEQSKPGASESDAVQPSGRTTRRSTANLGDAVRSDLEMEQIIASLGNDELTDPSQLSARNLAVIPDMISVTNGQVDYVFDDTNHLVDNPGEFYGPYTGIHDWTQGEKEIFLDKFAAYPKQFGVIANHLPNKTAAQCVDFYYLHKKTMIDFRKVISQYAPSKRRRRRTDKQKGNGLLADIRQHDAEVHRDSASPSFNGRITRRKPGMPPPTAEPRKVISSRRSTAHLELTPTSTPTPEPEARPRRRRANVSTAARTTVSISQDDGEEEGTDPEPRPAKRAKRTRKVKSAAIVTEEAVTPPVGDTKSIDQAESNTRRKPAAVNIQWSDEDKNAFLTLLGQHGDDFKRIAASMPNKTTIQVSNYYKSNLVELDLEKVAASAPKRSPTPEPSRDTWKDTQYPGSGIMSPVTGTASDTAPPMASLNLDTPQANSAASVARRPGPEPLTIAGGEAQRPSSTPWISTVEVVGSGRSNIPEQYGENVGISSRPYSPSQTRSHQSTTYPVPNGRPASVAYASGPLHHPSSFAPTHINPFAFAHPEPQYSTFEGPRSASSLPFPDANGTPLNRPFAAPSRSKGENPYPVASLYGGALSPPSSLF